MWQNQTIPVLGDWWKIHFLENPGMAFGLELGGEWGKLGQNLFRVIAVIIITRFLIRFIRQKQSTSFIICCSMVLAGALGNVIDNAFYGRIFSESPPNQMIVAEFMPAEGGYAPFMMGDVVDMLYFPLFTFDWPEWVPKIGGTEFEFFRPVFNIADSSIFLGLLFIFLFQKRFFKEEEALETVAIDEEE